MRTIPDSQHDDQPKVEGIDMDPSTGTLHMDGTMVVDEPRRVLPIVLAAIVALVAGILIGFLAHTASTPHDAGHPTIPLCTGCGYEVTTYYPNHKARTVNYFSTGGQQVTWSGVWVENYDSENKAGAK